MMKMINYVFLWLLIMSTATSLCACSSKPPVRTPEGVRSEGILRAALPNNNIHSVEYKVAALLAEALSAKLDVIVTEENNIAEIVQNGTADIGLGGFTENFVSSQLVKTIPYARQRQFLLTRRGEVYPSLDSIQDGKILYSTDSAPLGNAEYSILQAGISALLNGTADVLICYEKDAFSAVVSTNEQLQTDLYVNEPEVLFSAVLAKRNEKLFAHIDEEMNRLVMEGIRYGIF